MAISFCLLVAGTGHWVAEDAPDEMLVELTTFLAPYRDGPVAAHNPRPGVAAGA